MCSKGNSVVPSPRRTSLIACFRSNFAALLSAWGEKTWPKATIFLFLALWPLVPSCATCQTSEEQVEAFFRAGQGALKQGQFARAAEEFKKVLALDPSLVEAEVNLGLAYQSLLEYELAVRHLTKALRERPNLLGPTVIVGMDYLKLGAPEKAIPFIQRALKLDPSNREAHQALASSYLGQEDFRRAAEEFGQIAVLDSDKSEAWFKLGHEYLDLAARLAYRGAHLYRESAWGHRFLGDLLFQRDRWEDAVKEYQKALTADPRQSGLHTSLGQTYLHAGKLQEAGTEFHLELQLDSQNELAWLALAGMQLAKSQASAALESIAKVWEISPEFLVVQRLFPSTELPQGSAIASISRLQDEPETAAKHFLLAALYASANENALSDGQWKALQADFLAWQQAANAAEPAHAHQDPCKARHYFRCAELLQVRKQLTDSERLLLGEMHFSLQQYETAANVLAQVQGVTNENAEASYWLERTYQALGAEAYARLQESSPDSWRSHQLRAEGYALRQDFDNALKEFQGALQLHPDESELHEAVGELYLVNHSDAQAQSELESAVKNGGDGIALAHKFLGGLYMSARRNKEAADELEKYVQLDPKAADAERIKVTIKDLRNKQ